VEPVADLSPARPAWPPPAAGSGWYADPWFGDGLRWWDGRRWTHHAVQRQGGPRPPHDRLPAIAAIGAIAAVGGPIVVTRFLVEALADHRWPIAVYVALSALIGYGPSIWWARYVSRRWGTGRFAADVGLRFRAVDLGWGPVTWLACVGAQVAVGTVIIALDIPFTSNTTDVSDLRATRGYVVSMLILAVIVAPIVEEIAFRGVVLRGLLSVCHPAVAVGVQGAVFGAAHYDPARGAGNIGLVMVLAGVGVVLGGAAFLIRRITPSMIAHAILNAIAMAIALNS
jgi:uncharacterized protein